MTYSARLSPAPGDGRLVRRHDALLFVPGTADAQGCIEAFLDAPSESLDEVLAEYVLASADGVPDCVVVAWPTTTSSEHLRVLVIGAAAVSSDVASMPTLSGAGATSWVEHRVVRHPPRASIRSGAAGPDDTDLRAGVISAGGFHLCLERVAPATTRPTAEPEPELDALEQAAGTNWMEESLQLDTHLITTARVSSPTRIAVAASTGDATGSTSTSTSTPTSSEDLARDRVDPDQATTTAEQPALALLRLPDGTAVAVAGDLVLGRNPAMASSRLDHATLVRLDAPASVSRTHLSVSIDGRRILATDCGSRAGTALVIDGQDEPVSLDAWMPHEINGGDRLFLGGPTAITIEEIPST